MSSSPNENQLNDDQAPKLVQRLIESAVAARASDIHLEPTADGFNVRLRVDGLLSDHEKLTGELGRRMVTRLMVMAGLLTYRRDVPQEGRIAAETADGSVDLRLAIMPTTHGLRAAVRLPIGSDTPLVIDDLKMPEPVDAGLRRFAEAQQGLLIVIGPAGSGKTTTIYALLRHVAANHPELSIVALEDPVEQDIPGVTQIEVRPFGELTYARALRSIVRQDPQVLMIGEIRDAETASIVVQAALSGHRLITTLHAGDAAEALGRLREMGVEPYQITGGLFGVLNQRLMRSGNEAEGYHGRVPVAEIVRADSALRDAILADAGVDELRRVVGESETQSLAEAADELVGRGVCDRAERVRVLGPG